MFSSADKLRCVLRELRMRQRVYPRRVDAGRMHRSTAEHEIALMEEIVKDYEKQEQEERLI
jgi:hypothetical protein